MHNIGTERLTLSIIRMDDVTVVFDMMNHRPVAESISFLLWPMTQEQAAAWCRKSESGIADRSEYLFLARDKHNNPVGCVGVHPRGTKNAEIGYWVTPAHQGKGYATEMANAALNFAFNILKMDSTWATAAMHNTVSQRVLEKAGLRHTGEKTVRTAKGPEIQCCLYEMQSH